jgi:hypothetical protein
MAIDPRRLLEALSAGLRYGRAETGRRRRLMREFEAAGAALGL